MTVLVIGRDEVRDLLPMGRCMDAVGAVLRAQARGETVLPLRSVTWQPDRRGVLGVMPAWVADPPVLGAKVVSVFPGNAGTGLESHQGAVLLFETEQGRLVAIVDAGEITAIRTAAASGVATRALARPDARNVAILGSGTQARTHLAAMCEVCDVRRVRVWSRNPEHGRRFAASVELPVEVAATAREAVRDADIVCTVTAAAEPILAGEWVAPGTHLNAVGACLPGTRELTTDTVARARLIVDCRASAEREAGDYLIPRSEGVIGPDHIRGELGEVLEGRVAGRRSADEVTLFESVGAAVEDLAAAHLVYQGAVAAGRGRRVDLGGPGG